MNTRHSHDSVPSELRELKQWVCWKYDDRGGGKPTKVPVTIGGYGASSTDPADWYSFDEVCQTAGQFDGIGFVFSPEDPYIGIDLDDCLIEGGEIKSWASPVLNRLGDSYAEISPSGRGVKVICKATNPLETGRKASVEGGSIEIYSESRFFTITGNVWDHEPPAEKQESINWLAREFFLSESIAPPVTGAPPKAPLDKLDRAAKYLATMEPAVSGQAGHDKCFRAACRMIIGFDLHPDDAFMLLTRDYNPRCVPQWSDKELRHKVESANAQSGERGHLLNTLPKSDEFLHVDISGILCQGGDESEPPKKKQRSTLPTDCLMPPGLISEIIKYALATSLYPQPELALAGAIALVSAITGRKLTDDYGTRTNVYVLGLAPSGSGKEQARRINKEIMFAAGGEKMIGPERIGSSAGLVSAVADQPAILFQLDEIGRLLSTLKNPGKAAHLYNIATVLMQLYSASDAIWIGDAYADAKKVRRIDQPHAVVYGTSVAEGFWGSLTADNVSDGLLGRLMAFESADGYVTPREPQRLPVPQTIVEKVRWWMQYSPGGNLSSEHPEPKLANYTVAAKKRFNDHMMAIADRRRTDDPQIAAIWSRSAGKAGKLALIYAASRFEPGESLLQVVLGDVDLAIATSNWLTRRTIEMVADHVSDNEQEARTKRVLRILDKPLTRNQLTRKTQWLRSGERNEIVQTLLDAGLIHAKEEKTSGRTATYFERI